MRVMSVNVECLQQQQQLYLYPAVPYIDLHDTKKIYILSHPLKKDRANQRF